jgi:hypothetical protein
LGDSVGAVAGAGSVVAGATSAGISASMRGARVCRGSVCPRAADEVMARVAIESSNTECFTRVLFPGVLKRRRRGRRAPMWVV